MAQAHREAVQAFFAARGIATRKQAKRLYVARKGRWNGCAAYVEFQDPDTTVWVAAGLWQGCRLKVIPLKGARNWDYCRRVEAEIRAALDDEAAP